jgi:hypothetical protein
MNMVVYGVDKDSITEALSVSLLHLVWGKDDEDYASD